MMKFCKRNFFPIPGRCPRAFNTQRRPRVLTKFSPTLVMAIFGKGGKSLGGRGIPKREVAGAAFSGLVAAGFADPKLRGRKVPPGAGKCKRATGKLRIRK